MSEFWCEFEARTNWLDIYTLRDDDKGEPGICDNNNDDTNSETQIVSPRGSKERDFHPCQASDAQHKGFFCVIFCVKLNTKIFLC